MAMHHRRTVSEFMTTSVLSVEESDSIARALETMATAAVHHLPVVDRARCVVGVLSDRDLLNGLATGRSRADAVGGVMTRSVRTVTQATHAHEAVVAMLEGGFSSLPVERDDGTLVGIVTARDFLEVAEAALRGEDVARARESP